MGYARVLFGTIAAWASSLVPAASAQCEVQRLVPDDPAQFAYFGYSVAIDQGFVLVGAPEDDGFGANAGAAYVFKDQGGTWIQTAKLAHTGFGSSSNDAFGWAMELDGDTAWIGAPRDDPLGNASGAVFVFERSGSTWSQTTALSASDGYPRNGQLWAGCSNSTGVGARLTACGTSSASSDDIVLTASKLPPLHNTALVMGAARTRVPFGDGLRCIGPAASLFQFPMQVSSTEGQAHFGPGLVQLSQAQFGPAGHIAPGDTWYFQTFYRDPSGPCGSDFNATSALAVAFGP